MQKNAAAVAFQLSTPNMASLRRRIFGTGSGDSTPSASRDASPAPAPHEALKRPGAYRVLTTEKFDELKAAVKSGKGGGKKRRNAWVFGLGLLGGLFVAGFFASRDGALEQLAAMAGLEDMNLMDVLPTGLIRDVQDLQVRFSLVATRHHLHRADQLTKAYLYSQKKNKLSIVTTLSPSVSMLATRA